MRLAQQELRSTISESEKPLQERLEKLIETKLKSMVSRVSDLKDSVLELSHENLERDAKDAMRDKRYSWAVYKYCAMLDSSVKRETDYYEVPDILDSMKKALEMPGVKMYADDVTTTVDALKRLPAKYQVASEKLIDLVKSLQ